MPKIKTSRVKYPGGWELIEPTIRELDAKMREAENDTHDGKRKCEALWPIFRISHQRSRYIYDLYYRRKEISKELYEFCLDQGYADRNLIAKWKKAMSAFAVFDAYRHETTTLQLHVSAGSPSISERRSRVMSAFAVFDAYRHETTTLQLHVSAGSPSISERRSHTAGM
uniref:Protein BUD31 homolog n=1 Tax=Oryza meridionalis TaxID=40149 RepID=A0A0E0CAJ2_9ORYZ